MGFEEGVDLAGEMLEAMGRVLGKKIALVGARVIWHLVLRDLQGGKLVPRKLTRSISLRGGSGFPSCIRRGA